MLDVGGERRSHGNTKSSTADEHSDGIAANELDIYCMYLSTYAKKYEAIAFYGKNRFVPVATLPDVHDPNDEGNVYMRKIL